MEDRKVVAYGCRKTKKGNVAWKGKMLWLMAACLPPAPHANRRQLHTIQHNNLKGMRGGSLLGMRKVAYTTLTNVLFQ